MSSSFFAGPSHFLPKPRFHLVDRAEARQMDELAGSRKVARLVAATAQPVTGSLAAASGKSDRGDRMAKADRVSNNAARFDAVVKQADLTSEKLARLFARPEPKRQIAKAGAPSQKAPAPERFAPKPAGLSEHGPVLLAYADPSPGGAAGAALSTLLAPPPEDEMVATQDPYIDLGDDAAALPDYDDTPSDAPMPQLRPRGDRKPAAEIERRAPQQAEEPARSKDEDEPKAAGKRETAKPKSLAYARPSDPRDGRSSGQGFGQSLRSLFGGGAKAGNGVAVYDISAAKVYMPDGSVLEAHSGIGKMADNPRYTHVKMTGPTPPHTYNLRMREKRFHGVEAIRMLPVDGKNKHGRDGFLTHSYLLRGGRAESHGCVAFKDYDKFLNAFKKGKIKQLVVVPSGGRGAGMRMASNARSSDG